jgi:catechol 1,2-dioxygenase
VNTVTRTRRPPTRFAVTENIGNIGEISAAISDDEIPSGPPTSDDVLGPYYRPFAPFRYKVSAVLESGRLLVVFGTVWAYDTKLPIRADFDIWQANRKGVYDNQNSPDARRPYINRTRMVSDEIGNYEFETIHPGPYKLDETTWRAPHIHFIVRSPG